MNGPQIRVLPDLPSLASAAAEHIRASAELSIRLTGRFSIALAGGQTPRTLYQLLANPPFTSQIDWSRVEVFFGDERCVPPDDPESNFRMANEMLLDHVPVPYEHVFRIQGEIEPEQAAIEYGRMLKARFGDGGLDLVLLGMGDDGHTASLFPGSAALAEKHHRCVANYVDKLGKWRVTMTAPFINRAYEVLFVVAGQGKAKVVREVLEGTSDLDPATYPVQMIRPVSGRLSWYLDALAADM